VKLGGARSQSFPAENAISSTQIARARAEKMKNIVESRNVARPKSRVGGQAAQNLASASQFLASA
jgi:hypothetical protein